jgi:hypothetical protein
LFFGKRIEVVFDHLMRSFKRLFSFHVALLKGKNQTQNTCMSITRNVYVMHSMQSSSIHSMQTLHHSTATMLLLHRNTFHGEKNSTFG